VPRRSRRDQAYVDDSAVRAGVISRHPREFVGFVMATLATLTIFVNALFLQHGPHPAPIFAPQPLTQREAALPPHRPPTAPSAQAAARSQAQVTIDIQRELARRGYYDGSVDGIWGAKTAAAARDFVQAARLKVSSEPSEDLLRAVAASAAKPASVQLPPVVAATHSDPIAAVIAAPSKRLLAIQRALAEFGYGQIKPTGVYDQDTGAAIERFQRDRKLPVDGKVSDGLMRELASVTGRSLEQ
jgi:peptidoglycan hydrolase-like protein with peptidoglycan-binding domain